ncbi:hypothetical protein DL771_000524 [Monosporascus sp. 5C6A]|nr:hypothetical protein DL771_000524 [Monosporascus sp. 5C6A]
MAEPENFEDDLFADLYDDNEPSSASAPVAAPAPAPAPAPSQPQPAAEAPAQPQPESNHADAGPHPADDGYGDDYQEENYEDDDDVDFNLGNGSSGTPAAAPPPQQDMSAHSFHSTRGPSAKEDGPLALEAPHRHSSLPKHAWLGLWGIYDYPAARGGEDGHYSTMVAASHGRKKSYAMILDAWPKGLWVRGHFGLLSASKRRADCGGRIAVSAGFSNQAKIALACHDLKTEGVEGQKKKEVWTKEDTFALLSTREDQRQTVDHSQLRGAFRLP